MFLKRLLPKSRLRKWLAFCALLFVIVAVSGCQTWRFYGQAIKGQYQIFSSQEPAEKLLADGQTPARLKDQLRLVQNMRAFAAVELKLPVDDHYKKYADLHRPFVVWNVEAAPEFSLQPKSWWYPFLGSLEYRGYFTKQGAQKYGDYLKEKGYDVFVGGVEAYSTLGWFKDPLLNTFIFNPEADLAETIFHELGHQRVFARGDTDFNEAFATIVGQEGARRWLQAKGDLATRERYQAELRRSDQFVHLIMATRARLETLYGDQRTESGKIKAAKKPPAPSAELRAQKQHILADMQQQFAELKKSWNGAADYDKWFARQVNNAQLNSVAAYYDLLPGFERLLKDNGDDLEKFYAAAQRLAKEPKKERQQVLRALAQTEAPGGNIKLQTSNFK
ncbi:MAG: aminopeptidase [Verrucomicrobia bacterium]|nr:MAG: aminopeptidase [Verrucomicrobiota bacterium]